MTRCIGESYPGFSFPFFLCTFGCGAHIKLQSSSCVPEALERSIFINTLRRARHATVKCAVLFRNCKTAFRTLGLLSWIVERVRLVLGGAKPRAGIPIATDGRLRALRMSLSGTDSCESDASIDSERQDSEEDPETCTCAFSCCSSACESDRSLQAAFT